MTVKSRLQSIKAKDMMTKFAITVTEDQTINDLANLFMRFKISGLPVLNDADEVVGIVTASDLFNHMKKIINMVDSGQDPKDCEIQVKEIMTSRVQVIGEDTSLYDMIKLMCEKQIHTLPVVKDGAMVGIVGRRDVISACYITTYCVNIDK
ncbi:MAG: CBS domain-containing protein [Candidatus Omnitrophota bacterium]